MIQRSLESQKRKENRQGQADAKKTLKIRGRTKDRIKTNKALEIEKNTLVNTGRKADQN